MLKLRGRAAWPPTDLGTEKPQRPLLQSFPSHLFLRKKGHSAIPSVEAVTAWSIQVKQMLHTAAHAECLGPRPSDTTFSVTDFHDEKHAVETGKELNKHTA